MGRKAQENYRRLREAADRQPQPALAPYFVAREALFGPFTQPANPIRNSLIAVLIFALGCAEVVFPLTWVRFLFVVSLLYGGWLFFQYIRWELRGRRNSALAQILATTVILAIFAVVVAAIIYFVHHPVSEAAVVAVGPPNAAPTPFPATPLAASADIKRDPHDRNAPVAFRIVYPLANPTSGVVNVFSCWVRKLEPGKIGGLASSDDVRALFEHYKGQGLCARIASELQPESQEPYFVAEGDILPSIFERVLTGDLVVYYAGQIEVQLPSGESRVFPICGFSRGAQEVDGCLNAVP